MPDLRWLFAFTASLFVSTSVWADPTVFGSKAFTESVILGELAAQLTREAGFEADHRRQLGGTRVLWSALVRGDIDCYPEYTGTLRTEIFADRNIANDVQLRQALATESVWTSQSLGFNNTYVLGMRRDRAASLGITRMSQLVAHPALRLGFSNEFMQRADGWPGIRAHYQLPQQDVRGLAHDLAYRGLESGALDITDLYSTDAEIVHYELTTLEDDAKFFPAYDALIVCRNDVAPAVLESLNRLGGRINEAAMTRLNARAALDREPEAQIAASFLRDQLHVSANARVDGRAVRVWWESRSGWRSSLQFHWASSRSIGVPSVGWCLRSLTFYKHCRRWRCWCS
jgi:osmoprotectant transport system permease protein